MKNTLPATDNENESKEDGPTTNTNNNNNTTTLKTRGEHVRKMELFYYEEVIRGPCLGHGSFADVYEVQHFNIHSKNDCHFCHDRQQARAYYSEETNHRSRSNNNNSNNNNTNNNNNDEPTILSSTTPRHSKYAIKCLRQELDNNPDPNLFQRAAKDMETECDLLASLDHPHIVKVYAKSAKINSNSNSNSTINKRAVDFFLIEDRLLGTLAEKIKEWKVVKRSMFIEPLFFRGVKTSDAKKKALWEERLVVAEGVASALAYLHSRQIIYRDLKPDNVGFDLQGMCKLFDFGLARRLPSNKDLDDKKNQQQQQDERQQQQQEQQSMMYDTYAMSGKTGNMLLMAPEVWHERPYNEKADVYCFAILLWMVLALDLPFRELLGSDTTAFIKRVMIQGQRPPIPNKWPKTIQLLLRKAWSNDMNERPTMKEACVTLKQDRTVPGTKNWPYHY